MQDYIWKYSVACSLVWDSHRWMSEREPTFENGVRDRELYVQYVFGHESTDKKASILRPAWLAEGENIIRVIANPEIS
jgi:hypothetical protein